MENMTISHFESDAVQDKKLESYDWNAENFLTGQELTVTITLEEYRRLVTATAVANEKISASNRKATDAEAAAKEARKEADRLKAENYDLQNKLMAVTAAKEMASEKLSNESEGTE